MHNYIKHLHVYDEHKYSADIIAQSFIPFHGISFGKNITFTFPTKSGTTQT